MDGLHAANKASRAKRLLCLQFDKVQESFLSLEQQITTFQAHLEGLGKASLNGSAGKLAHTKATCSANSKTSDAALQPQSSSSSSASVPAANADADAPRSALHFSSTIRQLHKSGRKKWLSPGYKFSDVDHLLLHQKVLFFVMKWYFCRYGD